MNESMLKLYNENTILLAVLMMQLLFAFYIYTPYYIYSLLRLKDHTSI